MFKARLLLFLRLYANQAGIYTLKLISLAIAFACSILVVCFASKEFSVNQGQNEVARILRRNNAPDYGRMRLADRIPPEAVRQFDSPEFEDISVSRVKVLDQISAFSGKHALNGKTFHAVELSITNVFDFEFLSENISQSQIEAPTVLLSSSASMQLFGTTTPHEHKLSISTVIDTLEVRVGAVFKDWENNHEEFTAFVLLSDDQLVQLGYTSSDFGVYARVRGSTPFDSVATMLTRYVRETDISYHLQPLDEIYFGPRVAGENARHGDLYSVWILLCISGLIAFLGITNYANLTTLTLPARSTEFAISKVAGAESLTVCLRLVQESFVVVTIASLAGSMLVWALSSVLSRYFSIDIAAWLLNAHWEAAAILASVFLASVMAPLYPVIVFATAGPRRLLSADVISFPKFKRFITTLQLGTSISLIVAGLVIGRQINRSLIKEPGKNHDQVVYMRYPKELTRLEDQKLEWKRSNPNIVEVTAASQLPNTLLSKDTSGLFYRITVDHDFFSFFDIDVESGRTFKANDQDSVMVNAAARESTHLKPIGVVENFGTDFNQPERPLQISQARNTDDYSFLFIRILEVNIRDTYNYLHRFVKMFTQDPVTISFLDQRYLEVLKYEDTLNGLSRLLTTVGIIMACCAIFALGLSRINDNLKSIVIRRTFGASRSQIVYLISREFTEELLAAVLFFGPTTFLLLREWLRNFVYAAEIHWADPLVALFACLAIIVLINSTLVHALGRKATSQALRR